MAFTHVTMQSEKYVCVRETGATNNVVIVDMANPGTPMRRPITADSTILAPSSKTIALKAAAAGEGGAQGDNLQVFNLDTKQKLKAFFNPVKVQFWTWTSDSNIALVTDASVFHWDVTVRVPCLAARTHTAVLEAQPVAHAHTRPRAHARAPWSYSHTRGALQNAEAPQKVFDRTPNLQSTQIISYKVSPDGKWSTLIGIAPGSAERCESGR
jgi:clathrin heavy chain